jgi:hypothetical protein
MSIEEFPADVVFSEIFEKTLEFTVGWVYNSMDKK